MAPRIIDDPLLRDIAMTRLEAVVQRTLNPERPITDREWEVLFHIVVLQQTRAEIAESLSIVVRTVKDHLENIAAKCGRKYAYAEVIETLTRLYYKQEGRDELRAEQTNAFVPTANAS